MKPIMTIENAKLAVGARRDTGQLHCNQDVHEIESDRKSPRSVCSIGKIFHPAMDSAVNGLFVCTA
jgi:hypothetical protein